MSRPDEISLKSDYCAGVLSIQKVAVKHNIAKSTLIDMAKKNQWVREKNPTKKSDQNENGRTDGRKKNTLKIQMKKIQEISHLITDIAIATIRSTLMISVFQNSRVFSLNMWQQVKAWLKPTVLLAIRERGIQSMSTPAGY